ncbi:MAG: VWA domain-containing protein [Pseudomonadota bacterium]
MHHRDLRSWRRLLCAGATVAATFAAGLAQADDAELYQTAANEFGPDYYANVLFVIDTSGSMNSDVDGRSRLDIVKEVVTRFLNELDYVNVGLMRFDSGYMTGELLPDDFNEGGGMVLHAIEDIATARDDILAQVAALTATGTTQLSETMYEAASYMMGWDVYFGLETYAGNFEDPQLAENYSPSDPDSHDGTTYISPARQCQENHIVYLTDGQPQFDSEITDVVPTWPGFEGICTDNPDWNWSFYSVDGDGDCLDDIAAYLYENDLYGTEADGHQNVITHTIGFFQDLPLLEDTAVRGGGRYYLADDADTLLSVLEQIFVEVNDGGSALTSPGVSVNAFDRTTHLDQLYYSVFEATGTARWKGNLKRYRLGENAGGDLVVIDKDDMEAVDQNTGFFREESRSWWSDAPDGFSVEAGGVGSLLPTERRVLTEWGGALLPFTTANIEVFGDYLLANLDMDLLNGEAGSDDERLRQLLQWVGGKDIKDEDEDGDTQEPRLQLGDPMHSKPVVVTYARGEDEPQAVVFVGSNEGFLHAFDGQTGTELSAFLPLELVEHVDDWYADYETTTRIYGVDGPIAAWVQDGGDGEIDAGAGDSVYLYVGLRRGGEHLYAINYTDPANPQLMWKRSPSDSGFAQLGQTWSPITRTRVKTGTFGSELDQDVLVFGAGYDLRQDNYSTYAPDSVGNAIYMVNAFTGELVWSGSAANTADTLTQAYFEDMESAITGAIRVVDLNADGFADRLYAADLGGRVWRLDVHNPFDEGDYFHITGGVLASLGGAEGGGASDNRRFYYAPDVALGEADGRDFFNVTIASGYRAHPKYDGLDDYFFVVRDFYPFDELGLSEDPAGEYVDKYGFTKADFAYIGELENNPESLASGFYMPMVTAAGEKVLSETRIFQNKASFTSYLPDDGTTQACFAALGNGQLYSVDLGTGVVGVDELDKPGIPPEVVYIFTEDEGTGYIPPTCFGDYCGDEGPPEGDGGEEEELAEGPGGRDIGCVVGPESCDAAGTELPVKTFWRQEDTDDVGGGN